jgi:hypothetical protein
MLLLAKAPLGKKEKTKTYWSGQDSNLHISTWTEFYFGDPRVVYSVVSVVSVVDVWCYWCGIVDG